MCRPLSTDSMVKYIANSAAKNISSEDSQTIVPTLTKLGRLAGVRGTTAAPVAVVTRPLLRHPVGERATTPCTGSIQGMKVVVYSHDADTRARVRLAIGSRPAVDVPEAEVIEVATHPALVRLLDAGGADVMVLDGEARPAGGLVPGRCGGQPPDRPRRAGAGAGRADARARESCRRRAG